MGDHGHGECVLAAIPGAGWRRSNCMVHRGRSARYVSLDGAKIIDPVGVLSIEHCVDIR